MSLRSAGCSGLRILTLTGLCLAALAATSETRLPDTGLQQPAGETMDKVAIFYEWALGVRFTPEQKQELDGYLAKDWTDAGKRKSMLQVVQLMSQVVTFPEDKRKQVQATLSRALVDEMRKSTADPESAWLLASYQRAHNETVPVEAAGNLPASSFAADPRLLGKWRAGSVAATQYQNAYTGAPAPTSGSSFHYEFLPDGTYNMNGLLQITTYSCTSSVWRDNSGTYRVEGDRLYIQPTRGVVKSRVCGGQEKTNEDKRELQAHQYHFEPSPQGEYLVLGDADGKARPDYFRREK